MHQTLGSFTWYCLICVLLLQSFHITEQWQQILEQYLVKHYLWVMIAKKLIMKPSDPCKWVVWRSTRKHATDAELSNLLEHIIVLFVVAVLLRWTIIVLGWITALELAIINYLLYFCFGWMLCVGIVWYFLSEGLHIVGPIVQQTKLVSHIIQSWVSYGYL